MTIKKQEQTQEMKDLISLPIKEILDDDSIPSLLKKRDIISRDVIERGYDRTDKRIKCINLINKRIATLCP